MSFTVRPLLQSEVPLLKDFAPPEWNTDLSVLFGQYLGQPFFHPFLAEWNGIPAGCACGIFNGNAGWLGNIIVLPEFRGHGIGSALTGHLVSHFRQLGCLSQILIATPLGEPIYRKAGFITRSTYLFLRREEPTGPRPTQHIRETKPEDHEAIFALDQEVTGEARRPFLRMFLAESWVYHPAGGNSIGGYFLPKLSNGPIIARDVEAGLALLDFKLSRDSTLVVVPSANKAALDHLAACGFQVQFTVPRMVLGPEVDWHPEMVFSRGGGYCG